MNPYHKEHYDAFAMVQKHLANLKTQERAALKQSVTDYLTFRSEVDVFLSNHFNQICTRSCYLTRRSACCSREGIIAYFADIAVNVFVSTRHEIESLMGMLDKPNDGFKCVYLTESGCVWRVKPIVCEMFLCGQATRQVIGENPHLKQEWELLKQKRKQYTWPDQPVVFDEIEAHYLEAGYESPLMYLHNSPGLMHIKRRAGLC